MARHVRGSFSKPQHAIRQLIGIARRHQKTCPAFGYRFMNRTDIRRNNRPADAHRFENRHRVGLDVRRERENVHRRQQPRHVVARSQMSTCPSIPNLRRSLLKPLRGTARRQ